MTFQIPLYIICDPGGIGSVAIAGDFEGPENRRGDFVLIKENHASVALLNALNQGKSPLSIKCRFT
jgi:hypothetical protein